MMGCELWDVPLVNAASEVWFRRTKQLVEKYYLGQRLAPMIDVKDDPCHVPPISPFGGRIEQTQIGDRMFTVIRVKASGSDGALSATSGS